jgi:hypothetical protein
MRRVIESVIAGLIILFVSKGLERFGGPNIMKSIYQTFILELWPIWLGLLVALFYWITVDYLKLRRFANQLKEWIGYFSYPDKKGGFLYTNLKGKIKQYIQEELEKEMKNRVEVDTGIMERVSNLMIEMEDIRKTFPKKAII